MAAAPRRQVVTRRRRLETAAVGDNRLVTRGGCRDGGGNPESADEAGHPLTGPSPLERRGRAGEAPPKQKAADKEGRVVADESAAVKEKADRSRLVVASRPSEDSNSQGPLRDPAEHVPGGDVFIGSRPGDQISELTESFSWSEATSRLPQYAAGGKPFHCTDCGKAFCKSGTLRRHQLIHTGEKPYRCVECGSSFRDSATLKRHQRTHTGEKPYRCSECGKSFTRSEYLKSHQRIHTGEKPYRCSHCWRSFRGPGILKTHQRIHTGEKPYHCSECGKNFSHLGSIKIHMKVHSNEKYCRTH
ncbi:ZNF79 protein, partial [Polypterus senegalus]